MSPREQERRNAQRVRSLAEQQVLTFKEWCALNRISERNGRRVISGGHGPAVIHLSPRRIGISVGANADWQAARSKP